MGTKNHSEELTDGGKAPRIKIHEFDVEFEVESDKATIETVHQRLKEFSYYLVENIEFNLNFFLQLLEERPVPTKPTSLHVQTLSLLCAVVPNLPKWIGSALKTGEATIFRKIEKKNSRKIADLVYHFSDNKKAFREVVIDAALEVFSSFEVQFRQLTCNGGHKRAMQKLAIDAADRIFNYFLIGEQNRDVTKIELVKGVVKGDSKRNRIGKKEGKEVHNKEIKWKTCELYSEVGIVIPEKNLFYKTDYTNTKKFGYRKLFSWEHVDDTKIWIRDEIQEIPKYYLETTDDLKQNIKKYIIEKNPKEEAKLERKVYNEEAVSDRETKHNEILTILKQHFKQIYDGISVMVEKISTNSEETKSILETVAKNQEEENKNQEKIIVKLEEVHVDIKETKQAQETIIETNENIKTEIVEIKTTQNEMAEVVVKHEDIESIIQIHTEETTNEVKENLKTDLDECVKRELEKVKKEIERSKSKVKKAISSIRRI